MNLIEGFVGGVFLVLMLIVLITVISPPDTTPTPNCTDTVVKECWIKISPLAGTKQTMCSNPHDYYYETNTTLGNTTTYCIKDYTRKYN